MKTVQDFELFYQKELLAKLQSLEPVRKKTVRKAIFPIVCFVVGGILFLPGVTWPIAIVFIILGFFMWSRYAKIKKAYRAEFKEKIIQEIIRFISPELTYQPTNAISQNTFERSGIFLSRIDRYEGDDLITGKLVNTQFTFSELNVMRKEVYYDRNGRKERWVTVFKGVLFIADFNKDFQGRTYVLPDKLESWLGKLGKKFQKWSRSEPLVNLENPEFEKYFAVHSTDQVEARYILTPAFMEKIVALRALLKKPIYLSFVDSFVFVAIPFNKNSFEPNVFSKGTQIDYLREYIMQLQSILTIIQELDLNTRIWTKK